MATRDHAAGEEQVLVISKQFGCDPLLSEKISSQKLLLPERRMMQQATLAFLNQLLKLAQSARKVAEERGVVPLQSEEEPNFFASDTNQRIFEALRKIQAQGGDVPSAWSRRHRFPTLILCAFASKVGEPAPPTVMRPAKWLSSSRLIPEKTNVRRCCGCERSRQSSTRIGARTTDCASSSSFCVFRRTDCKFRKRSDS
jgi:hypothetical protein